MPTATTTTVATAASFSAQLPLKAALEPSPTSPTLPSPNSKTVHTSPATTLRSLYNRAARAFVLRDIPLTHILIRSAFDLLKPPQTVPDSLSDQRRKWDILRITFESTVYTSPPSSTESLPESLRDTLSESPQTLATSVYNRSLTLFTPCIGSAQKAVLNAAYLPTQVLTTLIYCSLKVDAPDVGRMVIEDWLTRRDHQVDSGGDGYIKVLDLYCLHILPRLDQWEYAKEFLEYEGEMPPHKREGIKASLNNLYIQAMANRPPSRPTQATLPSSEFTPSSPRSYSPAPSSSSSSSSSLSTTSTHTVVPATRGNRFSPSGFTNITQASSSSTSISSDETATPRANHAPLIPNIFSNNHNSTLTRPSSRPPSKSRTLSSSASSARSTTHPRSNLAHQVSARPGSPSIYALIKASLAPYLTSTKMMTFVLLFILIPLISFILRLRRQRRLMLESGLAALGNLGIGGGGTAAAGVAAAVSASSNAELVRRRLNASGVGEGGVVSRAWGEVVRVVGDTVRMAGSGLV